MKNLLALILLIPFLAHAATITYPLSEKKGGTGKATYTTGDTLYASGSTALTKRAIGSSNNAYVVSGGVPTWGTIALGSAAAVSGTLGPTNGGTGTATVTLGDLLYGSASNVWSKLATGSQGDSLVVTSTGIPAWTGRSKNYVLNSALNWWQRGTSFTFSTTASQYIADRFAYYVTTGTISDTVTQNSNTPTNIGTKSIKMQRDSGNANTASHVLVYGMDAPSSYPLAGRVVNYSFYAKAGANMSGSSTINVYLRTGTSGNEAPASAWTGETLCINGSTIVLTTSWARYSGTCTIPSGISQVGMTMTWIPSGTAGADDSWYFAAPMLATGSVVRAWEPMFENQYTELATLQSYFMKSYTITVNPGTSSSTAGAKYQRAAGTNIYMCVDHPTMIKTTPTCTVYSPSTGTAAKFRNETDGSDLSVSEAGNGSSGVCWGSTAATDAKLYSAQYACDSDL